MSGGTKLKRGLAELAIVVVGVVIALAADGVRQDVSDRRTEAVYLERLRADLEADQAAMTFFLRRMTSAQQATLDLAAALEGDGGSTSDEEMVGFVLASSKIGFVREGLIHDETYQELTSTGRLALIRDARLRAAIAEHYRALEIIATEVEEEMPVVVPRRLWRTTGHAAQYYDVDANTLSSEDQARLLSEFRASSEAVPDLRELHVWIEATTPRLDRGLINLAALIDILD